MEAVGADFLINPINKNRLTTYVRRRKLDMYIQVCILIGCYV
jgi:hypothetical protein